jgi:hypothetical protein
MAQAKKEDVKVIWFEAHVVDHSTGSSPWSVSRSQGRFPDAADDSSSGGGRARRHPDGARTVSLDYLIGARFRAGRRAAGAAGLSHAAGHPLDDQRAVTVLIDGKPILEAISGSAWSGWSILQLPDSTKQRRFYLSGDGQWFAASSIQGPWSFAQSPPAEVAALSPARPEGAVARAGEPPPRILISTSPAELLMTDALPDYRPIRGTALHYAADTDSQLFFHTTERAAYLLMSGRWFKAESLKGPWTYVARDLPRLRQDSPSSPQR